MDKCEYWKGEIECTSASPLVGFMRVECPNPECDLHKIKNICEYHRNRAVRKIRENKPMCCSKCSHRGHTSEFWTVFQNVSL